MNSTSGEVLAKEGADGLLGLSLRNKDYPDGLGILIKIAHGTDFTAMNYIAQAILKSLGYDIRLLVKGPHKQTVHINPELVPTRYREKLLHS